MIALTEPQGRQVLPFVRMLYDICLLRKGPESIPHSWLLLIIAIVLWLAGLLASVQTIEDFDQADAKIGIGSWLAGLAAYVAVLTATGQHARSVQTLTALIGCGALISFLILAAIVLLTPFTGQPFAGLIAFLILVWSVPVKGHIIARAINWHWYGGIVVAFSIFVMQLVMTQAMTPQS